MDSDEIGNTVLSEITRRQYEIEKFIIKVKPYENIWFLWVIITEYR